MTHRGFVPRPRRDWKIRITHNQNWKYFNPMVSGPGRFKLWKIGGWKSHWTVPLMSWVFITTIRYIKYAGWGGFWFDCIRTASQQPSILGLSVDPNPTPRPRFCSGQATYTSCIACQYSDITGSCQWSPKFKKKFTNVILLGMFSFYFHA